MTIKPTSGVPENEPSDRRESLFWDAFHNLVWFRRSFWIYLVILVLRWLNPQGAYHVYGAFSNPICISIGFFAVLLYCIGFQANKNGVLNKLSHWLLFQQLNSASLFFSAYLIFSPLLTAALSAALWDFGQSTWHPVLMSWIAFAMFLASPLYDLLFHVIDVPQSTKQSYLRKEITFPQLLLSGKNQVITSSAYSSILELFEERLGSWQPLAILLLATLGGLIVQTVVGICTADSLTRGLQLIAIVPCIFPMLAAGTLMLWKRTQQQIHSTVNQALESSKSYKVKIGRAIKTIIDKKWQRFAVNEFPITSVYLAVLTGISMLVFWPVNTAYYMADWFMCSLRDANIEAINIPPLLGHFRSSSIIVVPGVGSGIGDPYWEFIAIASIILWLVLYRIFVPIAWRLGASYQLFLQKLILRSSNNGLAEAVTDVVSTPQTKIRVRPQHPNWLSVKESLRWIIICYIALFSLIAFCPGNLGCAITNWLDASIRDADFTQMELGNHLNLKLFLASIFAAWGTAPVAIMSCAFLPLRRPDEAYVNEQGILRTNKLFGSPLFFWSDLRQVMLLNAKSPNRSRQVLKLVFRPGGTIKIRLNTIESERLVDLLAMADEYSANCKMDNKVIELRQNLLKEHLSSLALANKFESTIFRPLIAGDKLADGHLRIIRKLASKPLSAVYLARDDKSKLVVVKQFVTPNDDVTAAKYKAMFKREHEIIESLNHPMMAKLIDSFEEDGANYLVIEHISGENLRTYVERHGPRPEKIVLNWASQICQFMQYLHSQSPPLLHRDLTPDNIMLTESGQIRIVDFGAAHQFMEGITGTLIGKQCYIAPEQLRGKANVGSDIYSFGCMLYFLLSAKDPRALSQSDIADSEPKTSALMQKLIKTCTEFDNTQRPKSFNEIANILHTSATNMAIANLPSHESFLDRLNGICMNLPRTLKELIP